MGNWIQIQTGERTLASRCLVATTFWERLRGWMGKSAIPEHEAILFPKCRSVHTWFMRTPIDVVFLTKLGPLRYKVASVRSHVRPWSLLPLVDIHADTALELAPGRSAQLSVGQEVQCTV